MAYEVTTAAASLEFDTQGAGYNAVVMIDANHALAAWQDVNGDGIAQVFTVNTTAWAVTTAAAIFEFDTQNATYNQLRMLDANHFLCLWQGAAAGTSFQAQVLTVNTTTWAVTTAAALLTVNASISAASGAVKVDTNHFQVFFKDSSTSDGFTQILTVNTTTWAVTTAAASLEFEPVLFGDASAVLVDENHVLACLGGAASDGFAFLFAINTTTWAITTASTPLEFDVQQGAYHSCAKVDTNHFINVWQGSNGADGFAQVLAVNTTTWAVTTAAASLEFDTQDLAFSSLAAVDTNHFLVFWTGPLADGFTQVLTVNTTTWAVTTAAASLEFDTQNAADNACVKVDTNHFLNFWQGLDNDGYVQSFAVNLSTTAISSVDGVSYANVSSVNGVAKANIASINGVV